MNHSMRTLCFIFCAALLPAQEISLTDVSRLDLHNVRAEVAKHHGLAALQLTESGGGPQEAYAAVKDYTFHNGAIDVEVSGAPLKSAGAQARGFIGVAFRMAPDGSRFEEFYIRPTNGRASDQLRRNHAVQYVSYPDWPWDRLRKESPGVYESYADMLPGEWTHLRIVVQGTDASLYVGSAAQPCLLVHDLKLGDSAGGIALWIGPGTEGYFRGLTIQREN